VTAQTISHLALLALVVAGLAVAVAGTYAVRQLRQWHLFKVAHEKSNGHLRVRARIRNMVGRKQDTYDGVMHAETMYGWVWLAFTRKPREPYIEVMEWAPTKRAARRRLARYRDGR
jgi:hypothetical protein